MTTATANNSELFEMLASAIQSHLDLSGAVDEGRVKQLIESKIGEATRRIEISVDGQEPKRVDGAHVAFSEVCEMVEEGHNNLLLVGPAGTGKTTMARQLAESLDLEFGFLSISAGVTETHLFGRYLPQADGSFQYQQSRFVDIYENGGVFLLDEIDAADPNVMVAINAAMANGHLSNPNGQLHIRHPKTIIIGAANTFGHGGDYQYVGRNALDAATLDRFCLATVEVDYDETLEAAICADLPDRGAELLKWVHQVRSGIKSNRLRRIASTRLVVSGAKALKAGRTLDQIKDRYFRDWSRDERDKVEAA